MQQLGETSVLLLLSFFYHIIVFISFYLVWQAWGSYYLPRRLTVCYNFSVFFSEFICIVFCLFPYENKFPRNILNKFFKKKKNLSTILQNTRLCLNLIHSLFLSLYFFLFRWRTACNLQIVLRDTFSFSLLCLARLDVGAETSQRRQQLWQAVHVWEIGPDAYRQALHDELGSKRVFRLLFPQPGIRPARLSRPDEKVKKERKT